MNTSRAALAAKLVSLALAFVAFGSAAAQSFTIDINPGAYTGVYQVNPANQAGYGWVTGPQTMSLPAGDYGVDTGAEVGGSAFGFTVDVSGQVTNISNGSATAAGNTLIFNNVAVTVNPNLFAGSYYISPWHFTPQSGPQTVILVPDLVYYVDDGAYVGGPQGFSGFYFSVDGTAAVTSLNTGAGTGGAGVLTLNNVLVHVDPGSYAGTYNIGVGQSLSGPVDVELIPTLLTHVYIVPELSCYFLPNTSTVTPGSCSLSDGTSFHTFVLTLTVAVTVASVSPNALVQGAMNQLLTVTGTNFQPGASLSFSGSGVSVTAITSQSATQITASVNVAANAATGVYAASVRNLDGSAGTGAGLLTILTAQSYGASIVALIQTLAGAGSIAGPQANNLVTSINNATSKIGVNNSAAAGILGATLNKLSAFLNGGKLTQAAYDALVSEIDALLSSLP